jgi:hypothetical protein
MAGTGLKPSPQGAKTVPFTRIARPLSATILVATALHCTPALAEPRNGDELLRYCTATIGAYMLYCFGYIEAVTDSLLEKDRVGGTEACTPIAADDVQLRNLVVKFLQNNPTMRPMAAPALVARALHEGFPCGG